MNNWTRSHWVLALILAAQSMLLAFSAVSHSPTWDEVGHMAAGLSHWELRTFTLYSVNPPLVRTVATAPVAWLCEPKLDWRSYQENTKKRSEVQVGRDFIADNPEQFLTHFAIARMACIPLVAIGTLVCFFWGRSLFGVYAGLMAAGTWAFSPMVLGHGSLITADVAAASMGLAGFFCLRNWLQMPTWGNAQMLGICFALALLTKSTWVIAAGIVPIVWITWRFLEPGRVRLNARVILRELAQLSLAALLVTGLLNCFYGFEGSFRPLGKYEFVSAKLTARIVDRPKSYSSNRFRGSWLEALPVPLPSAFVEGLDIQSHDFERSSRDSSWRSYLFGRWKDGGWWYYYVAGLGVKEPLPWLILLVASPVLVWRRRLPGCSSREAAALLIPALICLVFVSSQTDMSRHVRYALPVLPFLFVWTSQYACAFERGPKVLRWFVGAMTIWFVGSALWFAPHWLSYFNELVGGPQGGHRALDNSNIDWGQDLLYLRAWLEEHPEAEGMRIAYFGCFDPSVLGIRYELPPPDLRASDNQRLLAQSEGPEPGWYAVSVNYVLGSVMNVPNGKGQFLYWGVPAYEYFSEFQPVARAGFSIWIYHITPDEANRMRLKMGLQGLRVPSA